MNGPYNSTPQITACPLTITICLMCWYTAMPCLKFLPWVWLYFRNSITADIKHQMQTNIWTLRIQGILFYYHTGCLRQCFPTLLLKAQQQYTFSNSNPPDSTRELNGGLQDLKRMNQMRRHPKICTVGVPPRTRLGNNSLRNRRKHFILQSPCYMLEVKLRETNPKPSLIVSTYC